VCAILALEHHIHGLRNTTVTYSLLLAILFFAVQWDRIETIVASVVAALGFLYYFQPPFGTFAATDPESYVAVGAFLMTAILVSQTELKAREQTAQALERKRETERLYELGQAMLGADNLETTVYLAINQTIRIFGVSGTAFHVRTSGAIHRAGESGAIADEMLRAVSARPWFQSAWAMKWRVVSGYAAAQFRTPLCDRSRACCQWCWNAGRRPTDCFWRIANWSSGIGRWNNKSRFPNRCC
jgi:K+-sensing histidine kinase KdpD